MPNVTRLIIGIAAALAMAGTNVGATATAAELNPAAEHAPVTAPDAVVEGVESAPWRAEPRLSDREQLRRYFFK
jgi:hypothetical protein